MPSSSGRLSSCFANGVPGSIFKIYAETWSASSAAQKSIELFSVSKLEFGRPSIKSTETLSMPASLAAFTASRTVSAVCLRPRIFNSASFADCIPIEIRLNPPRFSVSKNETSTSAGLHSVVISAFSATLNCSFTFSSTRHSLFAPNTLGVPPPKYTVYNSRSPYFSPYTASRAHSAAK